MVVPLDHFIIEGHKTILLIYYSLRISNQFNIRDIGPTNDRKLYKHPSRGRLGPLGGLRGCLGDNQRRGGANNTSHPPIKTKHKQQQ